MSTGAEIRRIRGQDFVVVTVSRMFPGPRPTVAGLARTLHLESDLTFHALLGYRSNAPAVIGLFRDQFGEPVPELEEARRRLRVAGMVPTATNQFQARMQPLYLGWGVRPDRDRPVVLPLSQEFRRVMDEAIRERRRQTRLQTIRPALDALRGELADVRVKAAELSAQIDSARVMAERHSREVLAVEALDGLLGAMLSSPKAAVDAGDRRDVEGLRSQLGTLRSEAHQHMLLAPVDAFRAGLVADRDRLAGELIALIEAPSFVEHVRTLSDNRDVVPPDLYRETVDALLFAGQTLLASPQADAALDRHVLPMVEALASKPIDMTGLAATRVPGLDAAIRDTPAPPASDSVYVILMAVASTVPLAVGNYPGPNTLAVGLLEWAAPGLLGRVASDPAAAVPLAGRLYRALVTCATIPPGGGAPVPARPAPLTLAERVALLEAIDGGDLQQLRRVQWSARFQSTPAWGAAVAVASAICLVAAVQSDDANTLRRWATITGSATGTALGVSVALGRYSALVQARMVAGVGGRALGVIGGVAAIVSGGLTARDEYRRGDTTGMWIAVGSATGGLLSVAGFLLCAGTASTATVAGSVWGIAMMVAGAALGIGAGIVSVVRSLTTPGTELVFETLLEHFGRSPSPFDEAATARPSLRSAFTAVQATQNSVDFWAVHPDRTPELFDIGFGAEHIVHIVDSSEADVTNRLRVAGRIR